MTITEEQRAALDAGLDAGRVKTKPGGRKNVYLETYDVQATANRIFGYDGWSQEQIELRCLGEHQIHRPTDDQPERQGWIVGYRCTMRIRVGEKVSDDTGYGDAIEYGDNPIPCHELAVKEAVSDAIKRAFKAMGDQFGLCLYDKAYKPGRASQPQRGATAGGGGASPPADGAISAAALTRLLALAHTDLGLGDREIRHVAAIRVGSLGVAESLKAIPKADAKRVEESLRAYAKHRSTPETVRVVEVWRAKNPAFAAALDAKQPKGEDDPW